MFFLEPSIHREVFFLSFILIFFCESFVIELCIICEIYYILTKNVRFLPFYCDNCVKIASATRKPSAADEVIPPA